MRSPARLVTGTAAAALTAAALGLATAPTVYADGPGRHGRVAATAVPGAEACLTGSAATDDGFLCDEEAALDEEAAAAELAVGSSAWSGAGQGGEREAPTEAKPGTGGQSGTWSPEPGTEPGPKKPADPGPREPGDPEGKKPPAKPPVSRPAPTPTEQPSGHVRTGVGGSAAPDTAQLAVGGGLLGAAAVSGVWLVRRSRVDGARDV
ncbi:hypothetical protein OG909_08610 [Streptomyces sp. NBC_01754]|uniref:hypothetical protein n=1 Tax=Streptomyces sp. NBC_01754 TaxID=2975930 RepID=UPI002DD83657|nr:hypothetical protein [Streptomyces sp. NBC_01754]WSC92348.1 hypothetical protein OG909_08610 [Streptomyces sp. NBC_01754]